jgi:hypothetical protein
MFSTFISKIVAEENKNGIALKKMEWGDRNYREKFTLFKRKVFHNLSSPLHS